MLLMLFDDRECCEGRNICRTHLKPILVEKVKRYDEHSQNIQFRVEKVKV